MKITFVARGNYPFWPAKIHEEGVGGAEYSLILLAQELGARGHKVKVVNDPGGHAGKQGDVTYESIKTWNSLEGCDIAVVWRNTYWEKPINCDRLTLFSCDQITDSQWHRLVDRLDRFFCISEYHRHYVTSRQGIPHQITRVVELGCNWPDYQNEVAEVPGRMIYCSVPDRGLEKLLQMWPAIHEQVTDATLVITSDYRLWGVPYTGNERYQSQAAQLEHLGVYFLGKVPRDELVNLQMSSVVQPYPNSYEECFCISMVECMAARCLPVTTSVGAITEKAQHGGFVMIGNNPNDSTWDDNVFVAAVVEAVQGEEMRNGITEQGRKVVEARYTFKSVADRFLEALED